MDERPSDRYLNAWTVLATHFAEGKRGDAVALARRMGEDFPERAAAIAHAEAGLLASAGRTDEAMTVVQRLTESGRWWTTRQLADPDLASLAAHPRYAAASSWMSEKSAEALVAGRGSSPNIIVAAPESGAPRGTVVALHMMGVSGVETAAIWAGVVETGIAVIAVESALSNGDGQPAWDDPDLAERDVQEGVALARQRGGPVVLAGGSQGAGLAARLALSGAVGDVSGFLCVVGAPSPGGWRSAVRVPGVLVAGGGDRLTAEAQRAFHREVCRAGQDVDLVEVPGLPHAYPDDWGDLAPWLLARLVERS